ncbi:nickel ABC transporter ATP-binding protein [Peribacillus butanolivorans]|uniref:ABC transporter ATP-binding protein n=1 Tax=Peribacillus butanolivorans TaxID=421767 RepID=UPI0006A6EFEF|nr:ABC transporter ATP-binding protein [Peribacillus butanolivorans]KON68832.1 nickel ABC transporter ATP-binding protein [Peribacillus butanolivorans]MCO0598046.1 ABC transporter ATP-binding protein [Peribacillus butanolivorans]
MGQDPILTVDNLNVIVTTPYGVTQTVHDVSFKLEAGKVLGLVGESGSGKTMTCMSLLKLLPEKAKVVQGSIKFKNIDLLNVSTEDLRKVRGSEIAMIMQNPMIAFNPVRTIGRHFIETLRTHLPITKRQARKMAVEYLEKTDLPNPENVLKQYPFQLSGGMLQRVMIAITMSLSPSIIIADEPTTALDSTNQLQVLKQLDKLREEYNTCILLVSHDLGVIAQLADEVAVMYGGYIVEKAPVLKLLNHPMHPYTKVLLESRLGLTRRKIKVEKRESVSRPNLINSEKTCPFLERCEDADYTCSSYNLEFKEYEKDHLVRCVKSR